MTGVKREAPALLVLAVAAALVAGCGDLSRDNPFDPVVSGGVSLRDQVLGSWSRADPAANEIYTFSRDGRVELRDFSSTSGGTVDRNAPFPETRVRIFEGTYQLVGNLLTVFFTRAQSNDPQDDLRPPATELRVEITIRRDTLTFLDADGKRLYTRLGQS